MTDNIRRWLIAVLGVCLCFFTLHQANFPAMQVQSYRAIFVMLGLALCFVTFPLHRRLEKVVWLRWVDLALAAGAILCCSYLVVQGEELFRAFWFDDTSIGNRAARETRTDVVIAVIGIILVLEATRRSIGLVVPLLAIVFILHAYYCYLSNRHGWPAMPNWMLPHAGKDADAIATSVYFRGQGVFGVASDVMFKYVFLFVVFGAFLEVSGATRFIIDFSERVFGRSPGGPAKVAVLGSGLMGSLSGSAVANAVTTGAFTIPMMRNSGFERHTAGGITAAAASGGALVPPVMGAGAYMMIELVDPSVVFLQIARAALIPACLYYFSLWMIVHFYSRRMGAAAMTPPVATRRRIRVYDGVVFFAALAALVTLLLFRYTAFRAVTGSLVVILVLTLFRGTIGKSQGITTSSRLWLLGTLVVVAVAQLVYSTATAPSTGTGTDNIPPSVVAQGGEPDEAALAAAEDEGTLIGSLRGLLDPLLDALFYGMFAMIAAGLIHPVWRATFFSALSKSARNGVSLVAASACVGVIIAILDITGIANNFTDVVKDLVEQKLLLALIGIMFCSIVLGMGVPSVVCYLLLANLMGALLSELGVVPLGAHLFIFYFGMMSMVTPPVALAAYASASIAEAPIMRTAFAAFRFSLVGFTLPYMFVYRPALLLMNEQKWDAWFAARAAGAENQNELLKAAEAAWPYWTNMSIAIVAAVLGILALAAGIAGYFRNGMPWWMRVMCFAAAGLLLVPDIRWDGQDVGMWVNLGGAVVLVSVVLLNRRPPGSENALRKPAPSFDPETTGEQE